MILMCVMDAFNSFHFVDDYSLSFQHKEIKTDVKYLYFLLNNEAGNSKSR